MLIILLRLKNLKASQLKVNENKHKNKHKNNFSKGSTEKLVKRDIYYLFCVEN